MKLPGNNHRSAPLHPLLSPIPSAHSCNGWLDATVCNISAGMLEDRRDQACIEHLGPHHRDCGTLNADGCAYRLGKTASKDRCAAACRRWWRPDQSLLTPVPVRISFHGPDDDPPDIRHSTNMRARRCRPTKPITKAQTPPTSAQMSSIDRQEEAKKN
eukprot:CAMPEP_0174385978 /NCGR_PEP_ID=MMETSP0811_2-20130205/126968_1 /TAXON_ID=73025 ORGANISM="Eutreptiella gymnastica-like, Strain CCMP1594" /NCGR_SAMPLE_ID=MMETSP0811_2 /ASSEMBLY_ACC=CAM_ASM_000667 /LENGTH=157 /DNA_ID=CAMNT_0015540493 /DNA_START=946 /DNA_END=1416 /DNA_ORIENTATION=-